MRTAIKQSIRFDIFNRDGFKCSYCWKSPDQWAKLQIDHIIPVAMWWGNEVENLVTACRDCNIWKSKKLIGSKINNRDMKQETKDIKEQIKILNEYYEYLREAKELERKKNDLDLFRELSWSDPTDFRVPHVKLLIKRYWMDIAIDAWLRFCDMSIRDVAYLFWIGKNMHNDRFNNDL